MNAHLHESDFPSPRAIRGGSPHAVSRAGGSGLSQSRRRLFRWAWTVCLALTVPDGLPADDFKPETLGFMQSTKQINEVLVPCPRELTQQLKRARDAFAEQEFADAIAEVELLLREVEKKDYFVGPTGQKGVRRSLNLETRELVNQLYRAQSELLETRWGTPANQQLAEAVQASNIEQLIVVAQKYYPTDAAREAAMLVGRWNLDHGRPYEALHWFQRLVQDQFDKDYQPEIALLSAVCWASVGNDEQAQQTLVAMKKRHAKNTVELAGEATPLFASDKDAVAWLKQHLAPNGLPLASAASQWQVFRGDASRSGAFDTLEVRGEKLEAWNIPASPDVDDQQIVEQITAYFSQEGLPFLPAAQPLVVADTLVFRTPNRIYGAGLRSGKRIWYYPGLEPPAPTNDPARADPNYDKLKLFQFGWQDAIHGQLSSDGQRIYFIDKLPIITSAMRSRNAVFIRARAGTNPGPRPMNQLVALDVASQGKLAFIRGVDNPVGDDLDEAFFLGAPLPVLGSLYGLVEINNEIRLVVLDAETGDLQWQMKLAANSATPNSIQVNTTRRFAGATPSYRDGVLICPTGAGAVIAINPLSRSLLWAFQYPTEAQASRQTLNRVIVNGRVISNYGSEPKSDLWRDTIAVIAAGRVLITPPDDDKLYCIDLFRGEQLWELPRRDLLYVGATTDDAAILVGKYRVTSVSLQDGKPAWDPAYVAIPTGGMPSGRGTRIGDQFLLPVEGNEVITLDVNSGALVRRTPTKSLPGNLVPFASGVVSQSASEVQLLDAPLKRMIAKPDSK